MAKWNPSWLEALLKQTFSHCSAHSCAKKKTEKNLFCLDCCTPFSSLCFPSHSLHRLIQVRRYLYHDVIRLHDLQNLIDCSNVKPYTVNNSKVVFIKKRPQRKLKGFENVCSSCERRLQEPYLYCSLGCKVDFAMRENKGISLCPLTSSGEQLCGDDETNNSTIVDTDEHAGASDSDNLGSSPCAAESTRRRKSAPLRSPLC